ncbi:MAG: insulinase family protein [Paucibacter sp.]|nr:insulinase family protein [Roseateles sp.]
MPTLTLSPIASADLDELLAFELVNRAYFEANINARPQAYYTPDGVGAGIGWSEDNPQSIWHLYAIFAPQNRAKVEDALRDETAHMLSDGFTEAEVKSGIQALLNQRRMAFDQRMDEAIAGLDAETVNAALRKYFKLDEFVMVFAGDFNQLAP